VTAAWRLTRRAHATPSQDAFNGIGPERYGGRWNSIGNRVAYASATRSLAALEYLAHVDPEELPDDLVFAKVLFDEQSVEIGELPDDWSELDSQAARGYGDQWFRESRSLVLAVPSVIIRAEINYVINAAHIEVPRLQIDQDLEDFIFDDRLFGR
jgi:RES domain-containing protein